MKIIVLGDKCPGGKYPGGGGGYSDDGIWIAAITKSVSPTLRIDQVKCDFIHFLVICSKLGS